MKNFILYAVEFLSRSLQFFAIVSSFLKCFVEWKKRRNYTLHKRSSYQSFYFICPWFKLEQLFAFYGKQPPRKKWSFSLRISSVNVIKSLIENFIFWGVSIKVYTTALCTWLMFLFLWTCRSDHSMMIVLSQSQKQFKAINCTKLTLSTIYFAFHTIPTIL